MRPAVEVPEHDGRHQNRIENLQLNVTLKSRQLNFPPHRIAVHAVVAVAFHGKRGWIYVAAFSCSPPLPFHVYEVTRLIIYFFVRYYFSVTLLLLLNYYTACGGWRKMFDSSGCRFNTPSESGRRGKRMFATGGASFSLSSQTASVRLSPEKTETKLANTTKKNEEDSHLKLSQPGWTGARSTLLYCTPNCCSNRINLSPGHPFSEA